MEPSRNPPGVLCPAFLIGCIRAARAHIQSCPYPLLYYLWKSANNARCITCSQMFAGPEASDFRVSSNSTSITIEWTVPEALKYYPVVQGYNISYREKDFEAKDGSKTKIVPSGQPEASAVASLACVLYSYVNVRCG